MRFEQGVENALPQSDRVRFRKLPNKNNPNKNSPGNTSGKKNKVQCGSKKTRGGRPRSRAAKKKSKVQNKNIHILCLSIIKISNL